MQHEACMLPAWSSINFCKTTCIGLYLLHTSWALLEQDTLAFTTVVPEQVCKVKPKLKSNRVTEFDATF